MKKIENADPIAQSENVIANNLEHLKCLFPEAFTEGKIDFEILKQLLGGVIEEREEKFGLNWHGKRQARQLALTPSLGTLRPCPEESVDWDTTKNLMIEGDNLEVLKLLQKSYASKVKVIYIDPPYNTGKDFIYRDSFKDGIRTYFEITGQVADGERMTSNIDSGGRFHTNWLNMIYPRIKVARSLLRDDGLIFISIDDNEYHSLRHVCDEIFGVENFIGQFVVNSSPSAIDYGHIAKMHDYVLMYAKNILLTETEQLIEEEKDFKYSDEEGPFNIYPLYNGNVAFNDRTRPNLFYPFYLNPNSKIGSDFFEISLQKADGWVEVFPVVSRKDGIQRVWRWGKEKSRQGLNKEIVGYRTEDGEFRVVQKSRHTGKVIRSLQLDKEISSRRGTADVEELFDEKVFSFPKPVELIRRFVAVSAGIDGIVMDFFAGSGTTAQAVLSQNKQDSGDRRFILVQLPEPISESGHFTAANFCKKIGRPLNITELTKERIRRFINRTKASGSNGYKNFGFRVFKLDSSNVSEWEHAGGSIQDSIQGYSEPIKPERTESDILYELLLKLGIDLCIPIAKKSFANKTVYSVASGVLVACLEKSISRDDVDDLAKGIVGWHKELAPATETTCVFLDSAFADDVAKTNLAAILNQHGISNVRSL